MKSAKFSAIHLKIVNKVAYSYKNHFTLGEKADIFLVFCIPNLEQIILLKQ
jgi:hypothetical protein